jgi:acyl-CoA synthetase (AMP-forming)/AMP-acid ligase II
VLTSGTTGAPKGAVLAHGNLLASAEALRLAWRWTPEDRLVLALPLFHIHGLGVGLLGLHGNLLTGASAVLLPRFDPEAPPDREELLAFAAELLAGFKRPRVVHNVESLPRNALGRVLRHELRG